VVHSNERPFSCDICPKAFKRKDDLKSHFSRGRCKGDKKPNSEVQEYNPSASYLSESAPQESQVVPTEQVQEDSQKILREMPAYSSWQGNACKDAREKGEGEMVSNIEEQAEAVSNILEEEKETVTNNEREDKVTFSSSVHKESVGTVLDYSKKFKSESRMKYVRDSEPQIMKLFNEPNTAEPPQNVLLQAMMMKMEEIHGIMSRIHQIIEPGQE